MSISLRGRLMAQRAAAKGDRRFLSRLRVLSRWRVARIAVAILLVTSAVTFIWIDRSVVHRFEKRATSFPSRVYAAPYTLSRGARIDTGSFLEHLERRGYQEISGKPARPGEFHRDGNDWIIFLPAADMTAGKREAFPARLDVWWGKVRRIRNLHTGEGLKEISLQPERLFTFYAELQEERRWTPLGDFPLFLQQAVVAVEDHRFRRHHGVDLIGIARAMKANVRAGGVVQGASTITQQLAKNLHGPGKRSLRRKVLEAVGALALELHYDKDLILEAYLNEVYLGQRGPVAISGVGDASRFFFGTAVGALDLPRCALVAGMIRNPGQYNPRLRPDEARARRDLVLRLMHEHDVIDGAAFQSAVAAPLGIADETPGPNRSRWIEDYLAQEIRRIAPEAIPSRAGFSIFTTFDPRVQRAAEGALREGLARLERRVEKSDGQPLEGAVVVLRPSDGALLALVGGRDYERSQFNRAVSSRRSPGSTFKPFVFLAGFERGVHEPDFNFTAASVFEDAPLQIRAGGQMWSPANYDRKWRGAVTVREALEHSINVPTVRAAMAVGLPAVVDAAHRCGIESDLDPIPSLALGTEEVTPLEMAAAYATFANGGERIAPHGLNSVTDREGTPYGIQDTKPVRVLDPGLAYLVTNLLEGVMKRGTGRSSAKLGFAGRAAGKTGSSDDLRDGWFVGYTSELLALVWVGYDDNRSIGAPGGVAALPIWVDLMKRLGVDGQEPFNRPRGVMTLDIDPATGERASRGCPRVATEIFVKGSQPLNQCELHGGRKKRRGLWRKLFGKDE